MLVSCPSTRSQTIGLRGPPSSHSPFFMELYPRGWPHEDDPADRGQYKIRGKGIDRLVSELRNPPPGWGPVGTCTSIVVFNRRGPFRNCWTRWSDRCGRMETLAATIEAVGGVNLMELGFSHNNLGRISARRIARTLKAGHCRNLKCFSISNNIIGDSGATHIAAALEAGGCPNLELLDISGCEVGTRGATRLAGVIAGGACLALRYLGVGATDIGAERFAAAIEAGGLPRLHQLNLSDSLVGDPGATRLAAAIDGGRCPQLWDLNCDDTNVTDVGKARVIEALWRSNGVKIMDNGDSIEDGVSVLRSGRCMSFEWRKPKFEDGGVCFAEALIAGGANLARFYVGNVGEAAADQIAAAIQANAFPKLRELGLRCEGQQLISLAGSTRFIEAIETGACPNLEKVYVAHGGPATWHPLTAHRSPKEPLRDRISIALKARIRGRNIARARRKLLHHARAIEWFVFHFKLAKARINFAPGAVGMQVAAASFAAAATTAPPQPPRADHSGEPPSKRSRTS